MNVLAPDLGFPPTERVVVSAWLVQPGDDVIEGDRLVELVSKEVTFDVPSPCSGRLSRICIHSDEEIYPGAILAEIEPESSEIETRFTDK